MCFDLQIRYAYELLTNPLWKRDYDLFGIDEHQVGLVLFYLGAVLLCVFSFCILF